ncbi:hypothetical protein GCM10010502_38690 [Kitasatospora aureofaciens]|uniref:Uncharacterized protein n=1 Tax=Kitasatospora aureofaciens TaxID=1894 RepID=A0A8H9HQM7_KITAU|nr:hypothetical protein GCM10010502_38690 [Kitasatospora aureofaciens]
MPLSLGTGTDTPARAPLRRAGPARLSPGVTLPEPPGTTTRAKLHAWISGAKAGEFDHFVA